MRVTKGGPFQRTGVDYAAPFEVKPDLPRSKVRPKKYVAVFVCMASKGVRLELGDNLSAKAFIGGFIRSNALRGPCHERWSDNVPNFVRI